MIIWVKQWSNHHTSQISSQNRKIVVLRFYHRNYSHTHTLSPCKTINTIIKHSQGNKSTEELGPESTRGGLRTHATTQNVKGSFGRRVGFETFSQRVWYPRIRSCWSLSVRNERFSGTPWTRFRWTRKIWVSFRTLDRRWICVIRRRAWFEPYVSREVRTRSEHHRGKSTLRDVPESEFGSSFTCQGKRYEVKDENTNEIEVKYEPEPENVVLYFGVHRKNLRQYMDISDFPEGFPRGVQEEFDSTRTQRLMIRDPVVSYAGRIKAFENGIFQEGPDAFTLLTGERGTGKLLTRTDCSVL